MHEKRGGVSFGTETDSGPIFRLSGSGSPVPLRAKKDYKGGETEPLGQPIWRGVFVLFTLY